MVNSQTASRQQSIASTSSTSSISSSHQSTAIPMPSATVPGVADLEKLVRDAKHTALDWTTAKDALPLLPSLIDLGMAMSTTITSGGAGAVPLAFQAIAAIKNGGNATLAYTGRRRVRAGKEAYPGGANSLKYVINRVATHFNMSESWAVRCADYLAEVADYGIDVAAYFAALYSPVVGMPAGIKQAIPYVSGTKVLMKGPLSIPSHVGNYYGRKQKKYEKQLKEIKDTQAEQEREELIQKAEQLKQELEQAKKEQDATNAALAQERQEHQVSKDLLTQATAQSDDLAAENSRLDRALTVASNTVAFLSRPAETPRDQPGLRHRQGRRHSE